MDTAECEIVSFPVMVFHFLIIESDILLKKMYGTRVKCDDHGRAAVFPLLGDSEKSRCKMSIKIASLS